MSEPRPPRFVVIVEEGPPRGDLYELEQAIDYHVLDRQTGRVVMTFRGQMEARLGRESGLWDDHAFSGVAEVRVADDEQLVLVRYADGREEGVPLPLNPEGGA